METLGSNTQFLLTTITFLILWGLYSFRNTNPIEYFKENKGIWSGIKFAFFFTTIMVLLSSLSGCSKGSYLKDGSVYMGLDMPYTQSPQCLSVKDEIDDKTTSNLGLRVNIYESEDSKFRTNAKYTHHSCAFNSDIRVYDAVGVEFEYKLFQN